MALLRTVKLSLRIHEHGNSGAVGKESVVRKMYID